MNYTVKINNKNYELPARTLDIDDRIEEMERLSRRYLDGEISRREMVQAQYDFVEHCAPKSLPDIDTVDVNELLQATLAILNAYNAPAIEAQSKAAIANVNKLVNNPDVSKMLALVQNLK